jgi:pimeloyl-ACP methyl ester carboxylesterase
MPPGNTYEQVVGRLIEVRLDGGFGSPADVAAMVATSKDFLDHLPPHERVVIAADWRRCTLVGSGTIERVVEALARIHPRVLRSAILVMPSSPTAIMQMSRVVTEAKLRERQVFTHADTMHAWLAELATPKESARLEAFLSRANSDPSVGGSTSSGRIRVR